MAVVRKGRRWLVNCGIFIFQLMVITMAFECCAFLSSILVAICSDMLSSDNTPF